MDQIEIALNKLDQANNKRYDWLVVLGLTALLNSILAYIGPSPKERERKSKR